MKCGVKMQRIIFGYVAYGINAIGHTEIYPILKFFSLNNFKQASTTF